MKAAISDLNSSPKRVKTWFGELTDRVVKVYKLIQKSLKKDVITYSFDCHRGIFAYTYLGSTRITLCRLFHFSEILSGSDNKLEVFVHELAHARAYVDDIVYGRPGCRSTS